MLLPKWRLFDHDTEHYAAFDQESSQGQNYQAYINDETQTLHHFCF